MKTKFGPFLIIVFLLANLTVTSQETEDSTSLQIILEEISETYGYRFNYVFATIAKYRLTPPSKELNIKEVLAYLQAETGLEFSFLANNFIAIKKAPIKICGYLKDRDTQKSLPYATIQSGRLSTISDDQGYFELAGNEQTEVLTIRYIGYKNIEREAHLFPKNECGIIYLIPQQQQLSEIVVYDYLIRGIDQLSDGSYQIDFSRFGILPGLTESDVLQSIQALPGIQSINETVSNINIRGGTHDQNLILWDDIKMYQSGHFFGLISLFNPLITQRVSLRKNGNSAIYTDGVSGTIDMQTDPNLNTQFNGSLGLNFTDVNGFIDTPLGSKSSLQLAARKAISNFVETPTYTQYFERISQDTELENSGINVINSDKSFDFYDTSLRWLWKPTKKDNVRLNFIYASNELVFNENANFNGSEVSRESSLLQSSIATGLQYQRQWNPSFSTSLHLYNSDYELKAINANIQNDQRFLQKNKVSETGLKLQSKYSINEQILWTNGYQFIETKVTNLDDVDNPIFVRLNGDVLRIHSLFSEVGYSSKDRNTKANVGLRYTNLEEFNKHLWEPRLSFNQQFLKWFSFQILGEFKHQNTSQVINFQNDFLGIEKRRWQLSNETDVPVITSAQGSLGISFLKNGWLLNVVGFYKEVDGITAQSQGFQNQYEFVKAIGSYDANGLDLLVRKQFNRTSTWLSYSNLNADYSFATLPERNFPSIYDITHSLTFGISYKTERLGLAAGWNWRTGRPTTQPDDAIPVIDGAINYGASNTSRLPDYMRVDISALYQILAGPKTKAQIGVSIWNILDKDNNINNFYRPTLQNTVNEFTQSSLGLTPNIAFRLFF